MGKLIIKQELVNKNNANELIKLCPFGAISFEKELNISSACKMCKLCAKKSGGIIEYAEEEVQGIDKSLWQGICVYADQMSGKLHKVTLELCGKARELADKTNQSVFAVLIGSNCQKNAEKLHYYGVDKVFVYEDKELESFRIEPYTSAFCDFIDKIKPSSVLVGATNLGRQLAPRVAARCRAGLTADCTVLDIKDNTDLVQIRPAFGGNIMAQIISPNTRPQFCTVRYKIFNEPRQSELQSGEIVNMEVTKDMVNSYVTVKSVETKLKEVDISEADVIVAVGRGAMSEGMCKSAEELAELLGGVVACSRPLAESNIYNAKHQIGISGRTVKPKLIICLGISGSVQFAVGMKSSDCIVAVNSDKSAPIFDIAHYCVIGDVNEIVPKLISKVKEAKLNV